MDTAGTPGDTPAVVRFAGLTLDAGGRTLTDAEGREIVLRPAEFGLLLAFLRHPGRALSRDALLDAAVGRRTEPFDRSIDVHVGRLRKKIETAPELPRTIVTVPGFGYKLVAEVRQERALAALGPSAGPEMDRRGPATLAVLPFATPEPDLVQQVLAMHLTESLIADLALSPRRPVVVGSLASRQVLREFGPCRLGHELGVRYVISGSVRRRSSALCICAQLADTVSAMHLWTERATIEQDELDGAQDKVSRRIALTIARQIAIAEGTRAELAGESDCAALIARGRSILEKAYTGEAAHSACRYFERALAVDSSSVEAAILLGRTLANSLVSRWSTAPARDEALAEEMLGRARLGAPRDPLALSGVSTLLCWQGRLDEAIRVLRWASELNPADPLVCNQLGTALMYRSRPAEALRWIEQSIDLDRSAPDVGVNFWALAACYQSMGHIHEALDWLLQARLRNPGLAFVRLRLAGAFGQIGALEEAKRELCEAVALAGGSYQTLVAYASERQASDPDYRAKCEGTYYAGLRAAGWPKGDS